MAIQVCRLICQEMVYSVNDVAFQWEQRGVKRVQEKIHVTIEEYVKKKTREMAMSAFAHQVLAEKLVKG